MEAHGRLDCFSFFRSYAVAGNCLPDNERLQLYDMIIAYGLDRTEPQSTGLFRALFESVRPTLDNSRNRVLTNRNNGQKGGRPKNRKEPTETQQNPTKPTQRNSIEWNSMEKDMDGMGADGMETDPHTPPTMEDIQSYCFENGIDIDVDRFANYYLSTGWKRHGDNITDWHALVRAWASNSFSTKKRQSNNPFLDLLKGDEQENDEEGDNENIVSTQDCVPNELPGAEQK